MSQVKSIAGEGVEITLSWQNASNGQINNESVNAGHSYVARAFHNGEFIPGKVVRGEDRAYICYDGKEIGYRDYQVLVDTHNIGDLGYEWKSGRCSAIPEGAVIGGSDKGKPLYIGRATIESKLLSGKFQPEQGCTYIPYDSKEIKKESFEVLCFTKKNV